MRGRILVLLTVIVVSLVVLSQGALSNSGGAPPGSAQDGCTCHGPLESGQATIVLDGLPANVQPNTTYNLTLELSGPGAVPAVGQNQGGFAVEADAGVLAPTDGTTQLREDTLTHTADGNDQREWAFLWTSPAGTDADFSFYVAGNAVNGNGRADPLDAWAIGQVVVKRVPAPTAAPSNSTPPPDETKENTPGPSALVVMSAFMLAIAVAIRRRRP